MFIYSYIYVVDVVVLLFVIECVVLALFSCTRKAVAVVWCA